MNKLGLLSCLLIFGCSHKSPYDITPEQAQNHRFGGPGDGGPPIDLDHLPPGAKKDVHVFKKGETMRDGSTAKGGEKLVTVTMDKGNGLHTMDRRLTITNNGGPTSVKAGDKDQPYFKVQTGP